MNVAKLMMEKGRNVFLVKSYAKIQDKHLIKPRGGGEVQRGAHLRYVFRGTWGLFLRHPHVRDFVKEGYFFCTQVRSMGVKIPLQSTKYTRL